ncbi:hypothetical protein RIF29_38547 [Crotalaria pallida]|uniref:Uncharacterized protein n=1 Tax=Crotalaria pallida TaxID=3830 RepID=A0AAN9HP17_CROPI
MADASLHTGGSIPHRVHWKRMKAELGTYPLLVDFYFRTHQKKDKSWVGHHAQSAYVSIILRQLLFNQVLGKLCFRCARLVLSLVVCWLLFLL